LATHSAKELLRAVYGPKTCIPFFPNPVLAEGMLDRLVNSAHIITMLGPSYRPQQRPIAEVDGST
jgi:hypothetical protein